MLFLGIMGIIRFLLWLSLQVLGVTMFPHRMGDPVSLIWWVLDEDTKYY